MDDKFGKVVSLCKRRGFVYPGSEIYGGLANTYDYGPLGVELKNNIKSLWWKRFVHDRPEIYGVDGGILLNPKIWEASGHTESFIDILAECKKCHKRWREDHLRQEAGGTPLRHPTSPRLRGTGGSEGQGELNCPECGGELTEPKKFVPMFKTSIGATEEDSDVAYLRPETAQAIFTNFKNVVNSFSPSLPFGIAQIGKAFRNEVTTGYFVFRTLEFEQMEIEYFVKERDWEKTFKVWQEEMTKFAVDLGVEKSNLKSREHGEKERSHYSKKTVDIEYKFSNGFKEIYGLAYRTDFDLSNHAKHSGQDLRYIDPETGEKFFPHVVEPSFGVERTLLPILLDAYHEEGEGKKKRVVLKLKPQLAPYKVAVFPLVANKPKLVKKAREVYQLLANDSCLLPIAFDDRGNIGKRYFAQDEIGTPWCVTIDYQTLEDETVTVRDRDTTEQERIGVGELAEYFASKLS